MLEITPGLATIGIALLTVFLLAITTLKYAIKDNFTRTRVNMTLFILFIGVTMSVSFWNEIKGSITFIIIFLTLGIILGYLLGVEAAKKRITMEGLANYIEHFAHVHFKDVKNLNWWSFVNFYSVVGALFLINLLGLSTVIFKTPLWATATLSFAAFLVGTLIPYIFHLWSIRKF